MDLAGLRVANPDGYKEPEAFTLASATVELDKASVSTDTKVINLLGLDGMQITLERAADLWNLQKLVNSASRFGGSGEDKPAKEEDKRVDQPLIIHKVRVTNTKVRMVLPVADKTLEVDIPLVEIDGIGTEEQNASVAKAISEILKALFKQALTAGKDLLPADALKLLTESGHLSGETTGKIQEQLGNVTESVKGLLKKQQ